MIKQFIILATCFVAFTSASSSFSACPQATTSGSAGFCSSFRTVAECHCAASGIPKGMCGNMKLLYNSMIGMFGSLERACEFQHDTSKQTCIDDWNCYRFGGKNTQNELCSTTGNACE